MTVISTNIFCTNIGTKVALQSVKMYLNDNIMREYLCYSLELIHLLKIFQIVITFLLSPQTVSYAPPYSSSNSCPLFISCYCMHICMYICTYILDFYSKCRGRSWSLCYKEENWDLIQKDYSHGSVTPEKRNTHWGVFQGLCEPRGGLGKVGAVAEKEGEDWVWFGWPWPGEESAERGRERPKGDFRVWVWKLGQSLVPFTQ